MTEKKEIAQFTYQWSSSDSHPLKTETMFISEDNEQRKRSYQFFGKML